MTSITRSALLLTCLLAAAGGVHAEQIVMKNQHYELSFDTQSQALSIIRIGLEDCRIEAISFPEEVSQVRREAVRSETFGHGQALTLSHEGGATVVALYDTLPLVAVRRELKNDGDSQRKIDQLPILKARLGFSKPVDGLVARGSAGLTAVSEEFGSYVFGLVGDPESGSGVVFGWASNNRGQGIVFPGRDGEKATLRTRIDYGDLRLPAGTGEPGELLLIGICPDVRDGLEQYADATAKHLDIKLRPLPAVYCTWYHSGASDEKRLAKNTDFAAENLKPWGLSVMQIDDKWQPGVSTNGPKKIFDTHDPEGPYPSGMKATADYIKSKGMVPGIWFMPFAGTWTDPFFADKQDIFYKIGGGDPAVTLEEIKKSGYETDTPVEELPYSAKWAGTTIDFSNPKSQAYLRQMVDRIANDWGYEYFKMDGFHTGSGSRQKYVDNEYEEDDLGKTIRHNPLMTPIEGYRTGMSIIREAAGDDVFFLGCCMVQNLRCFGTTFGNLDAMRVGPDNGAKWARADRGPRYGNRYYFLNKRVWYCDPDPFYVRPSLTYSQAITLSSWVALSGQLAASSYDYYELPPERLDIIRRVMPTHDKKSSRPLDYLERDVTQEWLLTDDASGVERIVVGHFNWSEDEPVKLSTPLEDLGLDPEKRYVGFDYWNDAFLRPFEGSLDSELEPASCRVLSVYPLARHPQVVSTSRHITQGVVDIAAEAWDANAKTLTGTSRVVGGDPYELRIVAGRWKAASAELTGGDPKATITFKQDGPLLRATIESERGGELRWRLQFERGAAR